MNQMERARQIQATMETPGWVHIASLFAEHISLPKDELFEIMAARPESVTGKAAFMRAGRSKGCSDLLEAIKDELKILLPTPGRSGAQDVNVAA